MESGLTSLCPLLIGGWYLGSQQTFIFCHVNSPFFFLLNLEMHICYETCTNLLVLKQCYLFSEAVKLSFQNSAESS